MSDNPNLSPENIPTKEDFKAMLAGLKDVIRANPKLNKGKILKSDIVDKGGYYNEKEATGLIPYLDEIMVDKEDRELRYEDYTKWSPNTLWAKINQAMKYIIDNLDPEGKYRELRTHLRISKEETGIFFRYSEQTSADGWILYKVKDSKKMLDNYKTRVYKFMETSEEGEELDIKENLSLTTEEVEQMKELFSESPIFMAYISPTRIKIVHTKQEDENPE